VRTLRAVAMAGAIAFQAFSQDQPGGSISGHVLNSVTGAAIGNAPVVVWSEEREVMREAVTDDVGAFRIAGIPDGEYMVMSGPEGYFGPEPIGEARPLRVAGDTRFDLKLIPGASLRGRVLDPEGMPEAGIAVKIFRWFESWSTTDEKGEFIFRNVMPGWYTLSATPKVDADAKGSEGIVTTYYPSEVDSGQAAPIQVKGADLSGFDIRLRTAPSRRISGVVIGGDGKPAAHAKVTIGKPLSREVTIIRGARTMAELPAAVAGAEAVESQEDGAFTFPPVLEGDWIVRAALYSESLSVWSGAVELRVSTRDPASDIDKVEIRLVQPFEVEVTYGGDPAPLVPLQALPLDGQPFIPGSAELGPPEYYAFAGRYVIGPGRLTPGYYLAAAMLDGRDVLGQAIDVSGPASLKMIYKTGGGSVRGTVEHGAYAIVVLMADATPAARLGISAQCDASGQFLIPDVPPGAYTVIAVQDFYGLVERPEFSGVLASSGKRVKVEAGATAQVDLKAVRQ
jgi:Carboxypeptidase regulatory-like domain